MRFGACVKIADYRKAQAAGFAYVELMAREIAALGEVQWYQLREDAAKDGLPIAGLNAYCGESLPLVGPDQDPKRIREYAELVMARASLLGARTVGIGSPNARKLPRDFPLAEADRQFRDFLNITSRIAGAYEIRVLVEPLNTKACNYLTSLAETASLVRSLRDPAVGLAVNFYHLQMMGTPYEDLIGCADILRLVRTAHGTGDHTRSFPGAEDRADLIRIRQVLSKLKGLESLSIDAPSDDVLADGKKSLAVLGQVFSEAKCL